MVCILLNYYIIVDSSPLFPLRCCAGSSSPSESCHALPSLQTLWRTCIRSRCCRSNHPTPSLGRRVRRRAPSWGWGRRGLDGCSRTCRTLCCPRCRTVRPRASLRHSWWRRWTPSLYNLQQTAPLSNPRTGKLYKKTRKCKDEPGKCKSLRKARRYEGEWEVKYRRKMRKRMKPSYEAQHFL